MQDDSNLLFASQQNTPEPTRKTENCAVQVVQNYIFHLGPTAGHIISNYHTTRCDTFHFP